MCGRAGSIVVTDRVKSIPLSLVVAGVVLDDDDDSPAIFGNPTDIYKTHRLN